MTEICKICVQNNQRPGIYFQDGICGACLYENNKKEIDWHTRDKELKNICFKAKSLMKDYDCVVGVSGGKDSTFQALYARDVLKLNTLLVNSEPDGLSETGKYNIENLIQQGFDCIKIRPNPKTAKKMMKRDFFKHLNFAKITEYSLWSSAYIIADKFNIPLIIQGENIVQSHGARDCGISNGGNCMDIKKHNTLSENILNYIDDCHDMSWKDLILYDYDMDNMIEKGAKGIWLGYYVKDWSARHNLEFSKKYGLKTRKDFMEFNPEDYGVHEDFYQMDGPEWFVSVNQYLKWVKFGFGQCSDAVNYDIRCGYLTREEGLKFIEKYDGKISDIFIDEFCEYIGISVNTFWETTKLFKNNNGKKTDIRHTGRSYQTSR